MKRKILVTMLVLFALTAAYGVYSVYLNRQQAQAEAVAEELVWAPLPAGTVWENVSSCYAGRCLLQGRGEDGSVLWAVLRLDGVVETLLPKAIGLTHVTYAGDGILESNLADGTESYSYLGSVPIEESQYAVPYSLRWSADSWHTKEDGWLPLYADRSEIAPLCEAAVGYACAIGLFDVDAVGCMEPGKTVSEADLSIYALRFLENSVNWEFNLQ